MQTAKEIQTHIEQLRQDADSRAARWMGGDSPQQIIMLRLEIVAYALQLGEISTQRLVELTKALKWLTAALVVVSVVTLFVMLK